MLQQNKTAEWVDGKRMKRRLLAFGVAHGQHQMNATEQRTEVNFLFTVMMIWFQCIERERKKKSCSENDAAFHNIYSKEFNLIAFKSRAEPSYYIN